MKNIINMPKVELHLHIEGTLKPALVLQKMKEKNLKFDPAYVERLSKPLVFTNLADFLVGYYNNMSILENKQDFFDMAWEHIKNVKAQNVIYTEVFFDPQPHISRGIDINTVIDGLYEAFQKSKKELDLSANLIMCFLKDESVESALKTLESAIPAIKAKKIIAIGFDSNEIPNWAQQFKPVVNRARELGLNVTTHAAENSFEQNAIEVLEILKPDRIDHGLFIHVQPEALKIVKEKNIHLSLCPWPNFYSNAWKDANTFPIRFFMDNNVSFSINSDDPAYLGPKTITDNYTLVANNNNLSKDEWKQLVLNTIAATFLEETEKQKLVLKVEDHFKNNWE